MKALLAAAVASLLLLGAYVALGGGGYAPTPVADPCAARPATEIEDSQRAVLGVFDGAACELGTSREGFVLDVVRGRSPAGASDEELRDALEAGVTRAREDGALPAGQAAALQLALRAGGADALIALLLR
jgi:hypothetical protein